MKRERLPVTLPLNVPDCRDCRLGPSLEHRHVPFKLRTLLMTSCRLKAHAATSLGVAAADAVAMATSYGWTYTEGTASLTPPAKGSAVAAAAGEGVTLQQLADITLHLEK